MLILKVIEKHSLAFRNSLHSSYPYSELINLSILQHTKAMSSHDYNYRAYSPNPNASPGHGAVPPSSDRYDERRGASMPDNYPPYPSHNSGIDYGSMPVLDDHGESVRLGMNS